MDGTKIKVMLDLNKSSEFGGPYRVALRISNSELNKRHEFCFVKYGGDGRKAFSIYRIKEIYGQILKADPDILHVSGLQVYGFIIVFLGRLIGCKNIIVTFRGTAWDASFLPWYKKILVSLVLEPLTLLLCTRFYCNSSFTHNRLISRLFQFKRSPFIYNYWRDDESLVDAGLLDKRSGLGLSENDVVVVLVGRITRDKGFEVFSEVAKRLSGSIDLKFIVVGDGDYLPTLKQDLAAQIDKEQVICVGHQTDVKSYLKSADIYFNPSLHETLSISTLEAMAAGLPCIVSDTGGLKEVVVQPDTGIRFPVGDVDAAVLAINLLRNSSSDRLEMGGKGRSRVETVFGENEITKRIDDIYGIVRR